MHPACMDKSTIIESCSKLLNSAFHVKLADSTAFITAADSLKTEFKSFDPFAQWKQNELNPQTFDEYAVNWIFLCDLLNFSFWSDENGPYFAVEFEGKVYDGYWSLPATLNNKNFSVYPQFYSQMTLEVFDSIFNPNIPLKAERIRLMREAGNILLIKYNCSFLHFLNQFSDAWQFINQLIKDFPSFRDCYNDNVWFLKRAQILVADLWAASSGKFFSSSIDQLTIFADYRIPQVLCSMGLIHYSPELQAKLHRKELVPPEEEAEIRAASIIACEQLKSLLNCRNAVELDYYLWERSQKIKKEIESKYPFHRVRSIYY